MLAETASLFYPHLSSGFVTATLSYLELPTDDIRAEIARCMMRSKGYTADVPASAAAHNAEADRAAAPTEL